MRVRSLKSYLKKNAEFGKTFCIVDEEYNKLIMFTNPASDDLYIDYLNQNWLDSVEVIDVVENCIGVIFDRSTLVRVRKKTAKKKTKFQEGFDA